MTQNLINERTTRRFSLSTPSVSATHMAIPLPDFFAYSLTIPWRYICRTILFLVCLITLNTLTNEWINASFAAAQSAKQSISTSQISLSFSAPPVNEVTPENQLNPIEDIMQTEATKKPTIETLKASEQPPLPINNQSIVETKPVLAPSKVIPTPIDNTAPLPPQKAETTKHLSKTESAFTAKKEPTSQESIATEQSAQSISETLNEPTEMIVTEPLFAAPPSPPRYPSLARKRGLQGTVWLEIWLNESGDQNKLQIMTSSGVKSLDQAAMNAVSNWKFQPYRYGDRLIASRVQIPVEFVLR